MKDKFEWWDEVEGTCQKLIQTPSLPGQEDELADHLEGKMNELDYDKVKIDKFGNLIGKIEGEKNLPSIGFSSHMDHVSPGDKSQWEYPPYSGKKSGGHIHGRGASDTKGAIATQVYIPRLIKESGVNHGDIYVIFVVLEEVGGFGSNKLDKSDIDYLILGEPTGNDIRIGHRGRVEIEVKIEGKSAHASVPSKASNPHFSMAKFISKFKKIEMKSGSAGERSSTAAPTLYSTDQESPNVIPRECSLIIDWRTIPEENEIEIKQKLENILPRKSKLKIVEEDLETYTGISFTQKRVRAPYYISPTHAAVNATGKALQKSLGREVEVTWWDFATDAGYFYETGIPVIGFSPCEEKYAHTSKDRVSVDLMRNSLKCYPEIIRGLSSI